MACDGADVRTIEGFDDDAVMGELREAFSAEHALQCGYCTPGMLVTARDIVLRLPDADEARIRLELVGQSVPLHRVRRHRAGHREGAGSEEGARAACSLSRSFDLAFPRETAWAAFQDVPMLVSCLPGASLASAPGVEPLEFGFAVKLGPIAANFTGQGKPHLWKGLHGRARWRRHGSRHGFAREGQRDVRAARERRRHAVRLSIDYALTGALAQFGRSGIVKELAAGITRQFAANLQVSLAARATGAASASQRGPRSRRQPPGSMRAPCCGMR